MVSEFISSSTLLLKKNWKWHHFFFCLFVRWENWACQPLPVWPQRCGHRLFLLAHCSHPSCLDPGIYSRCKYISNHTQRQCCSATAGFFRSWLKSLTQMILKLLFELVGNIYFQWLLLRDTFLIGSDFYPGVQTFVSSIFESSVGILCHVKWIWCHICIPGWW